MSPKHLYDFLVGDPRDPRNIVLDRFTETSNFREVDDILESLRTLRHWDTPTIHKSALSRMLDESRERYVHLRPFTERIFYDPGHFRMPGNVRTRHADTMGWSDSKTAAMQPSVRFNDNAFTSARWLDFVLGHELGHVIQHYHPDVYRGEAFYEVQRGDTLSVISQGFTNEGRFWRELYDLNRDVIGRNPDLIRPGQRLRLPGWWGGDDDGALLREFDATLRDLEGCHRIRPSDISSYNRLALIRTGNMYLERLEHGDPHWSRLLNIPQTSTILSNLIDRWTTARGREWREIRWRDIPGVLDLPQFNRFLHPQPKPWERPWERV
jgi:hypothetical protein